MSNKWFYTGLAYVDDYILAKGYYQDGTPILGKKIFKPYCFVNGTGEYKSFIGNSPLRKKEFESFAEMQKYNREKKSYGLGVDGKYLSRNEILYTWIADQFPEEIEFDINHIGILNYDIETTTLSPEDGEVLSISCSISRNNKRTYKTFGTKFCFNENIINFERCNDEYEMLQRFCEYVNESNVDVITGWNIQRFDTFFICERIYNNYKKDWLKLLSPFGLMPKRIHKKTKNRKTGQYEEYDIWEIEGLSELDSMKLYAKYDTWNGSMSLNSIAERELKDAKLESEGYNHISKLLISSDYLNVDKNKEIETLRPHERYTRMKDIIREEIKKRKGLKIHTSTMIKMTIEELEILDLNSLSLEDLIKIEEFLSKKADQKCYDFGIEYNQKDVQLVDQIIDKTRHIELAITISYLGKVNFEDSFSPILVWDTLIYNYLYKKGVIIPRKKENIKDKPNAGGAVRDAKVGFAEYVVTTDAESLYPSIIISLNISPETYVRKMGKYDKDFLVANNYGLASNGCMFDNNKEGVLSFLVAEVFKKRKEYKNAMKEEKIRGGDEDLIKKLDIFQYAMKILINSAYGVFSSVYFRYFNIDLAEAITITGQTIIQATNDGINEFLNKYLSTDGEDYIIFSDTDSSAFELKKVVEREKPENPIDFLDEFYISKIDPFLKGITGDISESMNYSKNGINFKREKLITKMVVIAKKRYFGIVNDMEGFRYKEPEMFFTGVEIVRSSTANSVKAPLKECMNIILNKTEKDLWQYITDFRKTYYTLSVENIAFPRGTNALSSYSDSIGYIDGTPIQARASILYNELLKEYGITEKYESISNSDKIKFVYLKEPNHIFQNVIGFKTILPKEFDLHEYIDYNKMYEKTFIAPLQIMLNVIGWSYKEPEGFEF